jgi:hypothetical protein
VLCIGQHIPCASVNSMEIECVLFILNLAIMNYVLNSYAQFGSVAEVMLTQKALELQTYMTVLTNKQQSALQNRFHYIVSLHLT